ncbi:hypothetical protein SEA_SONALI_72 [Arthrobacter phage Sonali]|uniref:Uncharacterized protein n=1 Tax=Arthrobacter phage Sonali TaxID=2510495 RepID=A0A411CQI8_9CAUD|nr:hypothetical protein HOV09_gp72 [Arthrobacter phage Sonali]QAY16184.1 hypothetical protein SEA_SONALI_72 [Arthrobacter phage Sonali]
MTDQPILPAEFPEPVMTADKLIEQSLKEGIAQLEYFSRNLSIFDEDGTLRTEETEPKELRETRLLRGNMHLFSFLLDAVIVDFIKRIQAKDPRWANEVADEVHDRLECGDYYPEMTWEWATEIGLDPEAIQEEAKARYAKRNPPIEKIELAPDGAEKEPTP